MPFFQEKDKYVKLMSMEGVTFIVEKKAANVSQYIKQMMSSDGEAGLCNPHSSCNWGRMCLDELGQARVELTGDGCGGQWRQELGGRGG